MNKLEEKEAKPTALEPKNEAVSCKGKTKNKTTIKRTETIARNGLLENKGTKGLEWIKGELRFLK